MTRKTRFILFLFLLVLFLIVAPLTIFYSLGWRFDWQVKKPVQPGIFYFKIQPKGAEIYLTPLENNFLTGLNGKKKKSSDFLFGSVSIGNLPSQKYEVEIKKEGYYAWRKSLEIKQGQVTEAKNIILITQNPYFEIIPDMPEDLSLSIQQAEQNKQEKIVKIKESDINNISEALEQISQSAKGFEFSYDSKKLAYYNNYEIYVLFLEKKYDQPKKEAGDKIFLTRFSEKIGEVLWLTDHYLIFNVENKIKIAEIDDRNNINIVDLAEFREPKISWDAKNKKLYVLSQEILYVSEKLIP